MKYEIPAYFGLIAALIGALAALIGQYFSSFLTSKREIKKLKLELVSEERCLAYLLGEVTLAAFYLRFAVIVFDEDNQTDNSPIHDGGKEALEKAQVIEEKIRLTMADYFKVITHFTNITTKRDSIIDLFNSVKDLEKPRFRDFKEITNLNALNEAKEKEVTRLTEVYRGYLRIYNKISEEMMKSINN